MRLPRVLIGLALLAAAPLRAQPLTAASPDLEPGAVVGPPQGKPLAGAALDSRTEEVASLLRCPVCQGLSVADSPASAATNMKAQVKEMLAAGYEQEQILSYFENSYGEFVRLKPPLRGVNWLVWLAPLLGLAGGAVVVAWALRRPALAGAEKARAAHLSQPPASADLPGPDTLPGDPKLAPYVLRARELAYGWPGGVRPEPRGSAGSDPSRAAS